MQNIDKGKMDHPNKKRRTCDDSKVNSERLVALRTASFSHIGTLQLLGDFVTLSHI